MNDMLVRYRRERRKNPTLPAFVALAIAARPRSNPAADEWEHARGERWTRTVDGFLITLRVETESHYPKPGDGYGEYVAESRSRWDCGDWNGNYPQPAEKFPLGLPYTAFRYTGVSQGDGGYFVPDEVEEQYAYYRRAGQSKSVAWDLTREWVEARISDYFGTPLTYLDVRVSAAKEGITLARTSMGTSILEDEDYVFEMVDEHAMVEEVIDEARDAIKRLTTKPANTREETSA